MKRFNRIRLLWMLLLGLLFTNNGMSQSPVGNVTPLDIRKYTVLDSANYMFTYRLNFVRDTLKNRKETNSMVLLVGNNCSKFFNKFYLDYENMLQKLFQEGRVKNMDAVGLGGTEIYKYYAPKIQKATVLLFGVRNTVYTYTEKLQMQTWKIESEKKKIHNYFCQKATTFFLGRKYIAWFTPEIPVSEGPWKFYGLPGLILEVFDENRNYHFECVGIEKLKKKKPIVEYSVMYKKTDRKSVNKAIQKLHTHFTQMLISQGYVGEINGKELNAKNELTFIYNPIELE